ncbi:multidrug effflux MFS transporter [Moheibacter sp. BDHS18]|uniref:Multidrug effflux MFS transporter n=1 Tax=Moheibacter lacus TaxID=2745851 RepID=A0A838ZRI9_9FLAO|nr:multidrug effflux MFS transporter [Moheibacter lacus]
MTNTKINKSFLIILLGILAALGPFTIDMYLPGFQRIAEDLYTDEQHVAFTLTSYFVGIAIGQLVYGPIVDKYGRKKPLLFGLSIYMLAALGCAFSVSIDMMIGMRFLQALGGCVGMVASAAIISDVYEIQARPRAFSYIMLVMGVAPLIAPSVGSFFVEHADWYYIFYFLSGFAFMVAMLIYFFLPETSQYIHSNKLKIKIIALDYYQILKNKTFLFYTLAGSIAMSILFAYISSASYVFLTLYKLDKTTFSILFAINASGLIIGSYVNGILTKKMDYIRIANFASVLLTIISFIVFLCAFLIENLAYQWIVGGLFSILFTIGFINPNATAASLSPFTGNSGSASALGGAMRMGVGAMVAAAIGLFQGNSSVTMFLTILVLAFLAMVFLIFSYKKAKPIAEK